MNHGHELNTLTADKLIATNNSQATMFAAALKDLNGQNNDARKEQLEREIAVREQQAEREIAARKEEKKEMLAFMEKALAGVHQAYASQQKSTWRLPPLAMRLPQLAKPNARRLWAPPPFTVLQQGPRRPGAKSLCLSSAAAT